MVISIEKAVYCGDYKIEFIFSDGIRKIIDFEKFLKNSKNPMSSKYLDRNLFGSFTLEYGDISWNNFELCFPIWVLYEGRI
jgi:hypothetical protein